jgi:glycosyltransferase involved in cell wall biosynthesis
LTIEKRREVGLSAALIGDEYLAASDKKIHVMPLGDVKALAGALRKLMADAELRSKLGVAARKRFEKRFHPDRVMGEILEVYREAARRRSRRSQIADS